MAHDFTIRVKNGIWSKRYEKVETAEQNIEWINYIEKNEYKGLPKDEVYFFGYAGGIFYKAFHCEQHNMLWSGDNEIITIDYETAYKGLKEAVKMFEKIDYSDPARINSIKEFHERMKTDYKDEKYFEIIFS